MKYLGIRVASILAAIGVCFLIQLVAQEQSTFLQRLVVLAGLYVTLAVSLNLINGITGQFSLGHAAFYMVGAYTTGVLVKPLGGALGITGVPWLIVAMIVSAATAALAGLIVGLPSLRLKGDYLAIVTLGFGEIIRIFAQNTEALGGSYGLNVNPRFTAIWLVWLLAILTIAVCRNLLKNAHGLPFLAVREDEVASAAMGVNVTRVKVTAFVLGAAFAGAAGALLAHFEGFVSPPMFAMDVSFIIVTMVVLGGTGSITGSALAAVLLFYIPEKMRDLGNLPQSTILAAGIGLIVGVALVKRTMDHYHGPSATKAARIAGFVLLGGVIHFALSMLFSRAGILPEIVEGSKLRMVVFAVTLVILMLLRPQGVFAHHEFSWSWVKSLFGKKDVPHTAVSA